MANVDAVEEGGLEQETGPSFRHLLSASPLSAMALNLRLQNQDEIVDVVVSRQDTVQLLLMKAQENFGIPKDTLQLLRNGVPLNGDHTVAQAGLDDYDVIVVGVKAKGGC